MSSNRLLKMNARSHWINFGNLDANVKKICSGARKDWSNLPQGCILQALYSDVSRLLAAMVLFFVLHAVTPGVFFGLSMIGDDSPSAAQNQDPISEIEEDENSDLNLKFLPPQPRTHVPVIAVSFHDTDEISVPGFVEEIPTPPPLV